MNTLIFRTMAPLITVIMLLFSVLILLRGHHEPGGGFIGGLIAASASAIYGMAFGVGAARRAMRFNPLGYAGFGVILAVLAGALSAFAGAPFLTALWLPAYVFGVPGLFDIGVYFVVFGALTAVALALEDSGG
ncbi:MAG TPA: MnhB domain-containing protein, partial [Devosia sp.]|nr:MnhB domain-containing protein [Devosia sp.]